MKSTHLDAVKEEAERLLVRIRKLERNDDSFPVGSTGKHFRGSALTGSVRRASMDLTRALAQLRKHN
jgi:hypothetical protein